MKFIRSGAGSPAPRARIFIGLLAGYLLFLVGTVVYGHMTLRKRADDTAPARRHLVRALELTDLALWTEARYVRNPSQADLFSAFQDGPGVLEHFPAGSLTAPAEWPLGSLTPLRGDALDQNL
jgi:hypothetical protein